MLRCGWLLWVDLFFLFYCVLGVGLGYFSVWWTYVIVLLVVFFSSLLLFTVLLLFESVCLLVFVWCIVSVCFVWYIY